MDGILEALLTVFTPNIAAAETEENSAPTETNFPCTQAAEQPNNDQNSLAKNLILSAVNSDVDASLRKVENMSLVLPTDLHSAGFGKDDNVDANSASTQTLKLHQIASQHECDLLLSGTDVLESFSVNSAAFLVKEDTADERVTEESLTHSLLPLSAMSLTVPLCPPRYLKLTFLPDEKLVSISTVSSSVATLMLIVIFVEIHSYYID